MKVLRGLFVVLAATTVLVGWTLLEERRERLHEQLCQACRLKVFVSEGRVRS